MCEAISEQLLRLRKKRVLHFPLLYQTGYLTIHDYDPDGGIYTLGFPNEEVKYGFLDSLMPSYVEKVGAGSGKDILALR